MTLRLIDRYVLGLTYRPILGVLAATVVALLLERILSLLNLLTESNQRFNFVAQLAANLVPHYVGLTLPAAFFIALFVVVRRLNTGSEVDAMLASGVSLSRIAAPFVGLGLVLAVLNLGLFGFAQPYSRYGFRAVLYAAQNAGWNGVVQPQAFVAPNAGLILTADAVEGAGQRLRRIFIRRHGPGEAEAVTTAAYGDITSSPDGRQAYLRLHDGQELILKANGDPRLLSFQFLTVRMPLTGAAKLLRARGGDQRELTLSELITQANQPRPIFPRQTLLAELYARIARSVMLPLLPLLALPLGLSVKRAGSTPGMIVGGVILFAFQYTLQLGQGLASAQRLPAILGVGAPLAVFVALSAAIFVTSRKRPGETPVHWLTEAIGDLITRLLPRRRRTHDPAEAGADA